MDVWMCEYQHIPLPWLSCLLMSHMYTCQGHKAEGASWHVVRKDPGLGMKRFKFGSMSSLAGSDLC